MQTATLILSGLSFAVSATTLVVVLVIAKKAEAAVSGVQADAIAKKKEFQRLVADL